jgi:hypothetical protein
MVRSGRVAATPTGVASSVTVPGSGEIAATNGIAAAAGGATETAGTNITGGAGVTEGADITAGVGSGVSTTIGVFRSETDFLRNTVSNRIVRPTTTAIEIHEATRNHPFPPSVPATMP